MYRKHSPFSLPASWQWMTKPLLAIAGTTTVVMAWIEETALLIGDIIAILALPVITSIIFLFNHFVFKGSRPTADDSRG